MTDREAGKRFVLGSALQARRAARLVVADLTADYFPGQPQAILRCGAGHDQRAGEYVVDMVTVSDHLVRAGASLEASIGIVDGPLIGRPAAEPMSLEAAIAWLGGGNRE